MSKRQKYGKARIAHKKKGPVPKQPQIVEDNSTLWITILTIGIVCAVIIYFGFFKTNTANSTFQTTTNEVTNETMGETQQIAVPELTNSKDFAQKLSALIGDKTATVNFVHNKTPIEPLIDVSVSNDNGVVMWIENDSVYIQASSRAPIIFPQSTNGMFDIESGSIQAINFEAIDTSQVTDMSFMFGNCKDLTELDLTTFITMNVTSMAGMFDGCESLVKVNVSSFDTSSVEQMHTIFRNCFNLISVDLSNFNTEKVVNMASMFESCFNLTDVNVSSFITTMVQDFSSMFMGCQNLVNLDISNFDISSATDVGYMFFECNSLENLDISGMDFTDKEDDMLVYIMPSTPIKEITVHSSEAAKTIKSILTKPYKTKIIVS